MCKSLGLIHGIDRKAGVATLESMVEHQMNALTMRPYQRTVLAEGMIADDRLEDAMASVDRAIEQIERPGWRERSHYAEALRVKATILELQGERSQSETCLQASLTVAREQQAKSWELRTATTYARVLDARGRRGEALELLQPIYDWFTEGFGTRDLREAKALLEELGG